MLGSELEQYQIHQGGMSFLDSRKPPSSSSTRNRKAPPVEAMFSLRHSAPLKRNSPMPMECSMNSSRISVKNLQQRHATQITITLHS